MIFFWCVFPFFAESVTGGYVHACWEVFAGIVGILHKKSTYCKVKNCFEQGNESKLMCHMYLPRLSKMKTFKLLLHLHGTAILLCFVFFPIRSYTFLQFRKCNSQTHD